jgi:hypothetical protein
MLTASVGCLAHHSYPLWDESFIGQHKVTDDEDCSDISSLMLPNSRMEKNGEEREKMKEPHQPSCTRIQLRSPTPQSTTGKKKLKHHHHRSTNSPLPQVPNPTSPHLIHLLTFFPTTALCPPAAAPPANLLPPAIATPRYSSPLSEEPQAGQSISILTVAQISPPAQGRCTRAADGQKAAKTVLVWPQGCVWA